VKEVNNMQGKLLTEDLLIDGAAKQTLGMIEKIVNSGSAKVRETVPSLVVTADAGCGVSGYGKVYGKIIEDSPLLQVRGSSTFIELTFPKNNPQDENLFFSSPQRAASIRNRFYGTMLISFEEYEGQDLLKSDSFKRLTNFIEYNKADIHFVFHVMPDFMVKSQLIAILRSHVNIVEVNLDKPDVEKAYSYLLAGLNECGFTIEATAEFREFMVDVVAGKTYSGYITLSNLINRIRYEMAVSDKEDGVIDKKIVDRLSWNIVPEISNATENTKIGFHI
jgi:hypothetical protein